MNVLVTGAAGFIGASVAAHLRQEGLRVIDHVGVPRAESTRTVREPLSIQELTQATQGAAPDAIIHAAGSGTVSRVAADPVNELPANLASLLAVLEFARLHAPRAHVILLSSAALYGDAPATPQREDVVRLPVSLYGLAKAQSEQLASHYTREYDLAITAVRLFSVYGPRLRKQLLWDAMTKFQRDATPEFFGTGEERRDWTHIDDVCRFMFRLLSTARSSGFDVLNCAGGQVASTRELLGELARLAGAPAPRFNGQARAGDPICLVADCGKALQQLDWRAQVDWRAGAAGYARWFAEQARASRPASEPE